MILLDTFSSIDEIRQSLSSSLIAQMSSVSTTLAAVLCGIALLVSIQKYIKGKEDLFHGILYPLVILALVCQFSTLVLNPVDMVCQKLTSSLRSTVKVSDKEYITHWSKANKRMSEISLQNVDKTFAEQMKDISESKGFSRIAKEIGATLRRTVERQLGFATLNIANTIGGVLFLLGKIVLFCQGILSGMLLCLLSLIGPLAFSFSVLPIGKNIITRWVSYYINLSLWPVMGLLVLKVNLLVCDSFVRLSESLDGGLSMEWMMIAVNLCCVLLILTVPRLCSMITLAPESEAIRSKVSSAVSTGVTLTAGSAMKNIPK